MSADRVRTDFSLFSTKFKRVLITFITVVCGDACKCIQVVYDDSVYKVVEFIEMFVTIHVVANHVKVCHRMLLLGSPSVCSLSLSIISPTQTQTQTLWAWCSCNRRCLSQFIQYTYLLQMYILSVSISTYHNSSHTLQLWCSCILVAFALHCVYWWLGAVLCCVLYRIVSYRIARALHTIHVSIYVQCTVYTSGTSNKAIILPNTFTLHLYYNFVRPLWIVAAFPPPPPTLPMYSLCNSVILQYQRQWR